MRVCVCVCVCVCGDTAHTFPSTSGTIIRFCRIVFTALTHFMWLETHSTWLSLDNITVGFNTEKVPSLFRHNVYLLSMVGVEVAACLKQFSSWFVLFFSFPPCEYLIYFLSFYPRLCEVRDLWSGLVYLQSTGGWVSHCLDLVGSKHHPIFIHF